MLLEFRHNHGVEGQLVSAHGTPVGRIEGENHRLSAEIVEGDFLVRSTVERKVWSLSSRR